MRLRIAVASLITLCLSALGIVAVAAPAFAAGQGTPPQYSFLYFTDSSGTGFAIQDTGHTDQADTVHLPNPDLIEGLDTISGVTYFQIEDPVNDLCLSETTGEPTWQSCVESGSSYTKELIRMAGTNGNELEFDADSKYITAASISSGALLSLSSTSTGSVDNEFLYSNANPAEQSIPVDFTTSGPTSGDWASIAAAAPLGEIHNAVLEICDPLGNCGGAATEMNTAWDTPLSTLGDVGVKPLYYISTGYGNSTGMSAADYNLQAIEADVSSAETWYGIYGIGFLFDEVQGVSADQCYLTATTQGNCSTYYQDLDEYVNGTAAGDLSEGTVVEMNPGNPPDSNYFGTGTMAGGSWEIIQVLESDDTLSGFAMPSWADGLPASDFAATIYGADSPWDSTDAGYVSKLEGDGVGNVYITNGTGGNPYNGLSSTLESELTLQPQYSPGDPAGVLTVP
jgi:hypothetical protein